MTNRDAERIRFVTEHFQELQGLRVLVPLGLILLSQGVTSFFPSWPVVLLQTVVTLGSIAWMAHSGRYYRRTFGEVERRPVHLGMEAFTLSVYSPAGPSPLAMGPRPLRPSLRLLLPAVLACALVLVLRAVIPSAILLPDGSGVDPWAQLHPPVVLVTEGAQMPDSWLDLRPVLGQGMYALLGALFLGVWLIRGRRLSQSYYLGMGISLLGLAMLGTFLGLLLPWLANLKTASLDQALLQTLAHLWLALILCGSALILAGMLDHWQITRALRPLEEES